MVPFHCKGHLCLGLKFQAPKTCGVICLFCWPKAGLLSLLVLSRELPGWLPGVIAAHSLPMDSASLAGRILLRNVVPAEIQHMPCTGGLVPGDRVAALRTLLVVPKGPGRPRRTRGLGSPCHVPSCSIKQTALHSIYIA